ncbi:DDE-type integrase/transposase/recombinase [Carnobacterium alterfunditum]|uniref:DDE-type integrase/transposase/recombinase n=1 Tax=Carnobacterium alterfunditum TaxID=28230 RepID=UPI000A707E9F|nr:DDE-type integrase/transposase/recombinase [Carnobacterium alterfunditum]
MKTYPGELVQVDIKYVPNQCIGFDSKGISYYQITAIDTFSSKRVLVVVDEKSAPHTALFAEKLEERMRFKIDCIQTDNSSEFMSVQPNSKGKTIFQLVLDAFSIQHIHTKPYSP